MPEALSALSSPPECHRGSPASHPGRGRRRRFASGLAVLCATIGALSASAGAAQPVPGAVPATALGAAPLVAAQAAAPTCTGGTFNATGLPAGIPDNNATGLVMPMVVNSEGPISSVLLSLNISHTFRGDLVVTLISPAGTPFVVSNRAGGSADNLVITNMVVSGLAGQASGGTWKLNVRDLASVDVGNVNSWSLTIGCAAAAPTWSASATPNLPLIDNGSACTALTVNGPGDAAVVKLDLSGRHDFRSVLRATLAHNGITVPVFPVGTFPAGSGTLALTNRPVTGMSGPATGSWTLCITDTDAFGDTGTLNNWSVHS